MLPTQPLPREAGDGPRDGKHSNRVPQLTYLAWLQPIINNSRLIFKHGKTEDALHVVKGLIRNTVATLISSCWSEFILTIYLKQLLKKMHFKTFEFFQKNSLQYCSLKTAPWTNSFQKKHFKITPSKNAFQNCYQKIFFLSACINVVKGKININKSVIMYGQNRSIHY